MIACFQEKSNVTKMSSSLYCPSPVCAAHQQPFCHSDSMMLRSKRIVQTPLRMRAASTHAGAGLYSYGEGHLGSLGTGSYDSVAVPTQLASTMELGVITQLSAGWAHAGFIADGNAYVYGRTQSFRDVIRSTNIQRIAPWLLSSMNSFTLKRGVDTLLPAHVELPAGEKAKKIVCSTALTFILTESGKLFTFGANSYGQCGNNVEGVSEVEPQHVQFGDGDEVVDIAAGYQHGLAVTKHGAVFSWGKGERGQLGFGTANIKSPQEIIALKGKKIVAVRAGFNHSSALTDDGELFVWGKLLNLKGKEESNGDQIIPRLVRTSDAVTLLECSHFHTSYITADDKIWIVGRTPSGHQEKQDQLIHVSSTMHATPFQITNEQLVSASSIRRIGKGVDSSAFVTKDGRAFEWTYTGGLKPVDDTKHLRVEALESGFKYRLLLATK